MTEQEKLKAQYTFLKNEIASFESDWAEDKLKAPKWAYKQLKELEKEIKYYGNA